MSAFTEELADSEGVEGLIYLFSDEDELIGGVADVLKFA